MIVVIDVIDKDGDIGYLGRLRPPQASDDAWAQLPDGQRLARIELGRLKQVWDDQAKPEDKEEAFLDFLVSQGWRREETEFHAVVSHRNRRG